MFAYVGCYTTPDRDGRGDGINVYRMDAASGDWEHVQLLGDVANPSFLALDARRRCLYCVHGGDDFGEVSAFAIDRPTGRLTFLGSQPSGGPNPVALSVDPTDRFLVVANYANGTAATLPIGRDGSLGPAADVVRQTGEPGPHPTEQTVPHPHHIPIDPARPGLEGSSWSRQGLDRIFVYHLDGASGRLAPSDPPSVQAAGGGPTPRRVSPQLALRLRHQRAGLDHHHLRVRPDRGTLKPLQVVSTLPPTFSGANTTAEIAVAPSGAVRLRIEPRARQHRDLRRRGRERHA